MRSAYPALLLCAMACASAPSTSRLAVTGADVPAALSLASADASTATRGQFQVGSFMTDWFSGETLADVLRRRAPLYLHERAGGTGLRDGSNGISIFINGTFSGGLETLSLVPAHDVYSVKRVPGTEAAIRFGPRHAAGALLVTLRRFE